MSMTLTRRQRAILEEIRRCMNTRGYPPSMREFADAVGLASVSSARYQLQVLAAKGVIVREPGCARAVRITLPEEAIRE